MNSMEGIGCELAGALGLERVDSQHPFCLWLIRLTKPHLGYLGGGISAFGLGLAAWGRAWGAGLG